MMRRQPINGYRCTACDVEGMADATQHVCWACRSAAHLVQQTPYGGASGAETVSVAAR